MLLSQLLCLTFAVGNKGESIWLSFPSADAPWSETNVLAQCTLTDQPDTHVNTDVLKEGEKYRFCCLSSAGVFSPQRVLL